MDDPVAAHVDSAEEDSDELDDGVMAVSAPLYPFPQHDQTTWYSGGGKAAPASGSMVVLDDDGMPMRRLRDRDFMMHSTPALTSALHHRQSLLRSSVFANVKVARDDSDVWGFGRSALYASLDESKRDEIARDVEDALLTSLGESAPEPCVEKGFHLADIAHFLTEGATAVVDDGFTKCFQSEKPRAWNWNWYLFPAWALGVVIRYGILFPLRLLCVLIGFLQFAMGFLVLGLIKTKEQRDQAMKPLLKFWMATFVASWSGVIRFRGLKPRRLPNQVFVANHTSMIDAIILQHSFTFAMVGQLHKGVIGWMQQNLFAPLQCIWFERGQAKDRALASRRIQNHIANPANNPLLIFPEGTCVNNKYCVMFKKGAFELGATVYPIAISYNKSFCDAFWNSREESFWYHLFRLMTAWTLVCDVHYLPPQVMEEGETAVEFANRVKELICEKADLTSVDLDGYLKYWRPSDRFADARQKLFAERLLTRAASSQDLASLEAEALQEESDQDTGVRKRNTLVRA